MDRTGVARRSVAFVLGIWLAASVAGLAFGAKPDREVFGPDRAFS